MWEVLRPGRRAAIPAARSASIMVAICSLVIVRRVHVERIDCERTTEEESDCYRPHNQLRCWCHIHAPCTPDTVLLPTSPHLRNPCKQTRSADPYFLSVCQRSAARHRTGRAEAQSSDPPIGCSSASRCFSPPSRVRAGSRCRGASGSPTPCASTSHQPARGAPSNPGWGAWDCRRCRKAASRLGSTSASP